jgi:hypothetical protein
VSSIAYGCSLGLDASKIGASGLDGSLPSEGDSSSDDVVVTSGLDSGAADADAGRAGCVLNADCVGTNTCEVGSCDAGTCTFVVCPTGACQGSTCSTVTSSCSAPTTYGFHASEVNVAAGNVGCGGNAAVCIAAAYPFVFVGTTNGVVAFSMSDPSNPTPPSVVVNGVPFLPAFLTAMGSRVYFVGSPEGAGPTYRLAVASLDVPSDPLVTSLQATTVFDIVSVGSLAAAWATTDGSLFLFDDDPTQSLPVASLNAPLVDGQTLGFLASPGIPAGAAPVVPSGSRLVVAQWQGTATPYQTYFSFETGAGTSSAQNSGEQPTFTVIGPTAPVSMFAQGNDGSILWNTATSVTEDGGVNDLGSTRVAWLVANGASTQFAPTQFLDVELYVPTVPYGTPVVGPVAWIDANTALVLASAAENLAQTSVQLAVAAPGPSLVDGGRYVVPQVVGQVGVAASGGYGYVLAAGGATPGASCTLHVFAPGCADAP